MNEVLEFEHQPLYIIMYCPRLSEPTTIHSNFIFFFENNRICEYSNSSVQNRIFLINNYLSPHESRVIVGNGIK